MSIEMNPFQNLDLGTSAPTSIKMETVKVEVSTGDLIGDYAAAFVNECARKAPLTFDKVGLTKEEVLGYCGYLMTKRIETIELTCKDWRKLKVLYVPSFIQYVLSCIGEVTDYSKGLKFVPKLATQSDLTFEKAVEVSDKIAAFKEYVQLVRDAMPRSIEGDPDVMASAIIEGYVRSVEKVAHPAATYVTAFAAAKLAEECAFKSLYRIQYDDVDYIRHAMLSHIGDIV